MVACLHFCRKSKMSFILAKGKIINCNSIEKSFRAFCTQYRIPNPEDEYTKTPQYPKILDLSRKCVQKREEESWYKKIERQPTIEEKLFELNVPRYWGWKCVMLKEGVIPYNSLTFAQHVTRTCILDGNELPDGYTANKELSSKLANEIKGCVEDELSHQLSVRRITSDIKSDIERDNAVSKVVINAINRVILREIGTNAVHLNESEVDFSPRIEAFWSVGGINPPDSVIKRRKKDKELTDEEVNEPIDRWVQYVGSPVLQLRHEKPLAPVWGSDVTGVIPRWTLDPEVLGHQSEYRHGTSIPGFWPGDVRDFSVLSYHLSNHLRYRPPSYGADETREALQAQGILASFGWLVPLAAYHGFSPFSEITYPMVTQTVLTDGKDFTFLVYQMNTNLIYSEYATENPKTNVCWCSPTEALYDRVEDGKVLGLNESVLAKLILLYLAEPQERSEIDLNPYLSKEVPRVAYHEEDEKRCWLEKEFKHFSANRPRHRVDLQYEMYEWERIYKVEHQTRNMDARRRPFELNLRPYQRKMSEHPGEYIPRALRPDKDLPKKTQKQFKRTFYPQ